MKGKGVSDNHINDCLKTNVAYAFYLGPTTTFYEVTRREQIDSFLNTKMKGEVEDPDKRWITPIIKDFAQQTREYLGSS